MKKLDEYFSSYNKNLDRLSNSNDVSSIQKSNYEPKIGIAAKNIIPMLVKLGLLSALVLIGISNYMLYQKNLEDFEVLMVNLLEKLNVIDTRSGFDFMNITDINYVELSDDELAAIGILKKGDTVSVITEDIMPAYSNEEKIDYERIKDSLMRLPQHQNDTEIKISIASYKKYDKLGYDTNNVQLIKSKYNISFYSFNSYTMHYQGWVHDKFSSFSPISIQSFCSSKARYKASYLTTLNSSPIAKEYESGLDTLSQLFTSLNSKKSINSMGVLSRLIPVKIKIYNKSGYKPKNKKYTIVESEIILWYVPTDEFINALPERYSSRLRHELEIIEKIESGEIKKEEACKELQESESILGLCPVHHENLEIKSIYPSPGREDTHIKFTNGKEQKLSVYLFDMKGEEVKCIADKKLFLQGEHNLWIDLSNLISGIYIAVIIDDEGNAISSKFIKE